MPRLVVCAGASTTAVVIVALLTSCSPSGGGGDRRPATGRRTASGSSAAAGRVSAKHARSIALADVHGGKVTAVSIGTFSNVTAWQVNVIHHGRKFEVEVAERTGKVLNVDSGG